MAVGARRASGGEGRSVPQAGEETTFDDRVAFLLGEARTPRARRAVPAEVPPPRPAEPRPAEPRPAEPRPAEPGLSPGGSPVERAKDFVAGHVLVVAIVVGLAIAVTLFWALRARPVALAAPSVSVSTPAGSAGTPSAGPSPTPVPMIVVHVLGGVRHAGVVRLPEGARVQDAIEAAGGLTKDARPGTLNLAQVLADGQQVVIGTGADPTSTVRGGSGSGSGENGPGAGTAAGQRLDLNTATQTQLEQLPGVGPVTARSILAWREQHGRFSRVEQLQEIDGIGPKTFARLEPYVRV